MSQNASQVTTSAAPAAPTGPRGPSMATVVWGLVLLCLAALAALTALTGWDVDPSLALPVVLLGAGALLVVTAAVAVARRPRRNQDPVAPQDDSLRDELLDEPQQSGATRPSDPV